LTGKLFGLLPLFAIPLHQQLQETTCSIPKKEKDYDYSTFRLFHQRQHDSHVHPYPLACMCLSFRMESSCLGVEDRTSRFGLGIPVCPRRLLSDLRLHAIKWRCVSCCPDGRIQMRIDSCALWFHHLHCVSHHQHFPNAEDIGQSQKGKLPEGLDSEVFGQRLIVCKRGDAFTLPGRGRRALRRFAP